MIRRDIRLSDGAPGWLLISQIEHARVSGELAALCNGRFGATGERAGAPPPAAAAGDIPSAARDEVLAAIYHHDDGWAQWEQRPQLDPQHGWPLAFTELAPVDAIGIWSRSIAAAERIGPLAASMVAGHFLRLARHADKVDADQRLAAWQAQTRSRRDHFIAAWMQTDPQRHTRERADETLQWLWTFDEVSLWLCCSCTLEESIPCAPEPYLAGRGTPIEMQLETVGPATASTEPWRFAAADVDIAISGDLVPAKPYGNWDELAKAAAPHQLAWRLGPRPQHAGPRKL